MNNSTCSKKSNDIEDIIKMKTGNLLIRNVYRGGDPEIYNEYLIELLDNLNSYDKHAYTKFKKTLNKKYHIIPNVTGLNYSYYKLIENKEISRNSYFEALNVVKMCRTTSGITQITVLSSPYPNGKEFSCEHNCYYCPNEPAHEGNNYTAQPRSYLYHEPAVRRANENNFDGADQMWDRMSALLLCGLNIDKLEVMVLGGTWGSYPVDYRYEFIRDLYYAANTFYVDSDKRRERFTLAEEIKINETALVRVIGLTLETRPDHVTANEIKMLNDMMCTRVQVGVQSLDDNILKKINRGCYYEDTVRAIKNLLNCGFKVDIHIMFDLPFASYEDDIVMANRFLNDENVRFDQAKLYPYSSMDWTVTKQWEDKGIITHYSQEELKEVLIHFMKNVHPWVRLNRVIRDIPDFYITGGNNIPNYRQNVEEEMKRRGIYSMCIRNREVKNKREAIEVSNNMKLMVRNYNASNGKEYFISFESKDEKYIYGFCRLRLSDEMGYINDIKPRIHRKGYGDNIETNMNIFPFLNNCAMIRELHVYGSMTKVKGDNFHTQHKGLGKKLLIKAQDIAISNKYKKIAVISGVGVRKYYEKHGYKFHNNYMIKDLYWQYYLTDIVRYGVPIIILFILKYFFKIIIKLVF
jgi:ELP3 family radical SAM enzyme/protein acetyltransferase